LVTINRGKENIPFPGCEGEDDKREKRKETGSEDLLKRGGGERGKERARKTRFSKGGASGRNGLTLFELKSTQGDEEVTRRKEKEGSILRKKSRAWQNRD